ncbi:MAG: peptidase [Rhodospirillales bacterium]|nr:peptidase [Rhodospirillales bacterium]
MNVRRIVSGMIFILMASVATPQSWADEPAKPAEKADEKGQRPPMPADVTSEQRVSLPGRVLKYHVTAGSLPMKNGKGEHKADIFYIGYALDTGKPAADRPITFVFNGGPGAASAYLHLGVLGPRRLSFGNDGDSPSTPPRLIDNPDTWLDFTDLVFIDPVGTGYSSTLTNSEEDNKAYWGVSQDVDSLSRFIVHYLTKAGRLTSPHYLVGESYGGFRGPKIAHHLQTEEGVGIAGIVLLSPALDFGFLDGTDLSLLPDMARLPSMAAIALSAKGEATPDVLKPVEEYAAGDYLLDLVRGKGDPAARDRMADKVASLIGLDPKLVRQLDSRIGSRTYARELRRDQGLVTSVYDGTVKGFDAFPDRITSEFEDPILQGTIAPVTSAIIDYIQTGLGYRIDQPYHLLSYEVNGKWDWNVSSHGGEPRMPSAVDDLRQALALDPHLKVMISHGMTDTVTPYFATKYIIDHVPAFGDPNRLQLKLYAGGHMHYSRDASRAALRADAMKLYPGA